MARFSTKFLRFLEVNNPAAFKLIPKGQDVPDELYNQIIAANDSRYKLWLSIPQWIKDRCRDKIPDEVASGRMSVEAYVKKQEEEVKKEQKDIQDAVSVGVSALAVGYAAETAATLAENSALRESLLASANGEKLTPEQLLLWLESRKKDIDAIRTDWKEHHPERYLLHLAKKLSRTQKRLARAQTPEEKSVLEAEVISLKEKFNNYTASLGTIDTATKQNTLNFLSRLPQQAALRHMDKDTLNLFTEAMQKQGIKITQMKKKMRKMAPIMFDKESLTQALRTQFDRKLMEESIIEQMSAKAKTDFRRITARQALRTRHPSLTPILRMRHTQNVQPA